MKLIYPDGTVIAVNKLPDNFTGIVEGSFTDKEYKVNGVWHRDGGLPALEFPNGDKDYYVNGSLQGCSLQERK